uniref:C2H2-type domain-containing protein n=1 Tax=Kalanchoe fedtschenkoi TaxID=63787 RepID=A0A7N1A6A6_KALFE
MELKHSCKICNRKFANGKSMGGHMRSHFAKLPILSSSSASRQPESLNARAPVTCLSSSYDPLSQKLDYGCGGYQAKNATSANRISAMAALRVRASSRKRSKRIPRFIKKESKPISAPPLDPRYGEFTSPETLVFVEDAARCLMKLSKDKWPENDERLHGNHFPYFVETHSEDDTLSDEEEDEEGDLSEPVEEIFGRRCQMCKKVFKNYQALGGHMRNHRRPPVARPVPVVEKRVFQCEICLKVFGSGQALGGHKKVHLFMDKKNVIENDLPIFENDPDSDCEFRSESTSASETSSDT